MRDVNVSVGVRVGGRGGGVVNRLAMMAMFSFGPSRRGTLPSTSSHAQMLGCVWDPQFQEATLAVEEQGLPTGAPSYR